MIGRQTKWKISIVDGGDGGIYVKEVIINGSDFVLLRDMDNYVGNMYPNSIQKLTVEYMGEVDEDQGI